MSGSDLLTPAATLAGRYRVVAHLGTGTAGAVYRAEDVATGGVVAVKVLPDASRRRVARLEREARVLRELGIPGVVRLLDEGTHDGRPFLVTQLVDGAPFPGPAIDGWEGLAATVIQLFETLARVHEAGVLHRDLKPSNVLVDAAGVPTVLDFGLARFISGTSNLTATGDVLGTPRYQAPEQVLCDRPIDARADLYAAGVMIYEVLAGRSPQPARSLGGIYSARIVHDPPALRSVAPDVPPTVARIVDRLVARAPDDRPGSARAVLEALAGAAPARPAGHLPWLGGRLPIARVVDAARAGRAVTVTGLRGAGRTRLFTEVEQALDGARILRIPPGERPFESLIAALGGGEATARSGTGEDVPTALATALRTRLRRGDVLLVDDAEGVDAWTLALLDGAEGAVLRGGGDEPVGDAGVHLDPLPVSALVPLFADPIGASTFGATLLHQRTAGLPSRVAAEVGAWVAAGHARWAGDHLLIADEALELLAMGPPPDTRLGRRATPAGLPEPLAVALMWIALAEPTATSPLLTAARRRSAWEIEAEVRALVERGELSRSEDGRLLVRADRAVFDTSAEDTRVEAVAALAAAVPPGAAGRLGRLLAAEAWPEVVVEAERVAAEALLGPGDYGSALAAARWGLRAWAASDEPTAVSPLLGLLVRAAGAVGTAPALEQALAEVRGAARGDPGEAADAPWWPDLGATTTRLHAMLRAIRGGEDEPGDGHTGGPAPPDAGILLERAEILLEAGIDAGAEADALAAFAERHRLPLHAAYARALRRATAYRTGEVTAPDLRFVARVQALGVARLIARVCLVEAAAAWRSSRYDDAARLARLAAAAGPDRAGGAVLARAVELASADGVAPGTGEALVAAADALPDPAVGLQVRGLVALALPGLAAALLPEAEALAARVGRGSQILDVLSGAEAIAFCRASARRARPPPPRPG